MTATASNKTDFETLCPASEPLQRAPPQDRAKRFGRYDVRGVTHAVCLARNGALTKHHARRRRRSEEHTSELQSRFDIVCRLLLEKKNRSVLLHILYIDVEKDSVLD